MSAVASLGLSLVTHCGIRRGRRQMCLAHAFGDTPEKLTLQRRSLLPSFLALAGCSPAARAASDSSTEEDYSYSNWFALPLAPYRRRRTLLSEVVPGQVWTLDQIFGTFYVYVPIRATVLAVTGGLLVYAPVAATRECLRLIRSLETLHGPVRWIVHPSKAVEHKVVAGPFAREFPTAKLFIAPGQFSFPVDLPLPFLGFPDCEIIDPTRLDELPWADDCDTAAVDIGTFGEVALFHRRSQTLVLVDSLVAIPEEPPPLLLDDVYARALSYHARDVGEVPHGLADMRRLGWSRIALFATFFNPGALWSGNVQIPETGGSRPWQWQVGWQESFERLRDGGRPFVVPIIRELIFKQSPAATRAYVARLASWNFVRVVPAHFSSPLKVAPRDLGSMFAFLDEGDVAPLWCAEDLSFLGDLQKSAIPNGRAVSSSPQCGYAPRD